MPTLCLKDYYLHLNHVFYDSPKDQKKCLQLFPSYSDFHHGIASYIDQKRSKPESKKHFLIRYNTFDLHHVLAQLQQAAA